MGLLSGGCGEAPTFEVVWCFIYSKANKLKFIFDRILCHFPGKSNGSMFAKQLAEESVGSGKNRSQK